MVLNTTHDAFDADVLQASTPVLLDLWAPWCGPCRVIAPQLETLGRELEGTLKVVKLDVQEHPATAKNLKVSSIPTLILFREGAEVARKIGAAGGLPALREFLRAHGVEC